MKRFELDFYRLYSLLCRGIHFAFSKYADGEYAILKGKKIKNIDGWLFHPEKHKELREELMRSFTFAEPGYYVGISCPCCVPRSHVNWMRKNVGVNQAHLTWANIWVNSNYPIFMDYMIPEFGKHDVVLVSSERSNLEGLGFDVEEHFGITDTAWRDNIDLVEKLIERNYNDKLLLFCAGPLGNILSYRLWQANKNNTYLDIGSTLNPMLGLKPRGYQVGGKYANRTCVW